MSVLAQCVAEIRSSHESCDQMPVLFFQKPQQISGHISLVFLRNQVEIKAHDLGSLCLCLKMPVFKERLLIGLLNLFVKLPVLFRILCLSDDCRHLRKQLCGICIVGSAGQVIGRCPEITAFLGVKSHPVAKLKLIVPDVSFRVFPHEADPFLHAVILFPDHFGITVHQIHGPGNDHVCVRPCCRGVVAILHYLVIPRFSDQHIRDDMRNTAILQLIRRHVGKPLSIEGIRIHQIRCRAAENLRVSGPSEPFVPLRTVGRHIQEVAFHSP